MNPMNCPLVSLKQFSLWRAGHCLPCVRCTVLAILQEKQTLPWSGKRSVIASIRSRPPGPLLRSLSRKPCRLPPALLLFGASVVDVGRKSPARVADYRAGDFLRLATYNSQVPHSRTSRPKTAGSGRGTGHTGRSRGYCRGPSRPGRAGQRPAKPPTSTTDKPPDTARRRHTARYTEHRNTPKNRLRDGRETRHRAGRPPRFPPPPRRPADKAADGAGLKIWPACKCA